MAEWWPRRSQQMGCSTSDLGKSAVLTVGQSFPVYPYNRTSSVSAAASQKGQERSYAPAPSPLSASPWFTQSRPRSRADLLSAGHGASSSKFDRPLFKLSAKTPRSKEALLGADTGSQSNAD